MQPSIKKLVNRQDLTADEASAAMTSIMTGEAGEVLTAAFLTALAMKRETPVEIEAFARSMRKAAVAWKGAGGVIADTCGTGGDGTSTLNLSTLSALTLASAGVKVAKHGNRAVSSSTGSADLLEALGVSLSLQDPDSIASCLERSGIAFLFAQAWHPAMKFAGPVRRALGFRTVFNILGPLTNPAPVTHQLVGVFHLDFLSPVASALLHLGRQAAFVVHSADGLDEISPAAPTRFARVQSGKVELGELSPEDFGANRFDLSRIIVRGKDEAVDRARAVCAGQGSAEENTAVALNAAPLFGSVNGADWKESFKSCLDLISSGALQKTLDSWKAITSEKTSTLG